MHIHEGVILSGPVLGVSAGAAALLTAYTLKKTKEEDIPRIAVMTAAFFAVSLYHFQIGPTSSHLVFSGLMGILLGWSAFPAILVGLLFQAIMFQHGGFTTLGVNTMVIGVPALAASFIFRAGLKKIDPANAISLNIRSFLAGTVAILLSAFFVACFLIYNGSGFEKIAKIFYAVNIPLAFLEGAITAFIVSFLIKVKPVMVEAGKR
ncbi:MAG: cobalt transporter CbiM [bacterium]|nr:cobalt transporter CbiM [bacterium]